MMSIGTNIYTLRKAKKITQGQLARKLGVSEQAVSKWENDLCAPDVSLFPIIADYFNVSIDRLFGFHMNSYSEEVRQIIKASDDSHDTYKEIEILSEGLERYPNSPDLKIALAFSLSMLNRVSEDENERKESVEKAIKLCNEVVDTCGDVNQVDSALNMLGRIYGELRESRKALDAIEKISANNYFYRVAGIARTLGYEHADTELIQYVEKNLFDCWLAMDLNLQVLTSRLSEVGKNDAAAAFNKAHLKLLSVFDDGCDNFYTAHKVMASFQLSHNFRKLGDRNQCLGALRSLAAYLSEMKAVSKCSDFNISARNPLYFSHIANSEIMEECMTEFPISKLLSAFDNFFGNDEQYLQVKKALLS